MPKQAPQPAMVRQLASRGELSQITTGDSPKQASFSLPRKSTCLRNDKIPDRYPSRLKKSLSQIVAVLRDPVLKS
jgi:hypothetical protein